MAPLLGLVTTGQTPRPDLELPFQRHATGTRILTVGALDGLSCSRLEELESMPPEYPLLTRLADGQTFTVLLPGELLDG